jgi:hypothetical protein
MEKKFDYRKYISQNRFVLGEVKSKNFENSVIPLKEGVSDLMSIMKSKYENQGYSLKKLHDEVIDFLGKKEGGLIFQEFISKNKSNKKIKDEFEKTSF